MNEIKRNLPKVLLFCQILMQKMMCKGIIYSINFMDKIVNKLPFLIAFIIILKNY